MAEDFTLTIKKFDPVDRRLGRHVLHDSRSRQFPFKARPRKLASVRHVVNIPIMDQGNVGSCTGHAGTNALASGAFWAAGEGPLKAANDPHDYAVGLYSDATLLDPWPGSYAPDDTGSDGLSIAKVLHARGLVSGYSHAFSLPDALAALAERVSLFGVSWYSSMFEPDSEGRLRISGQVEGGHEIAGDELDVNRGRVWFRNQWGSQWGQGGRAFVTFDDLGRLLNEQGDCTVLVPKTLPPPEPTPPAPPFDDKPLAEALRRFLKTRAVPAYVRPPAEGWLKSKG